MSRYHRSAFSAEIQRGEDDYYYDELGQCGNDTVC